MAMLTSQQRVTLKTDIQASSDTNSMYVDGNLDGLAALYNAPASPTFWVWRTFVPDQEIYESTTADGTVWSWSLYITRSQGERDAWRQMVNMAGGFNASLANARAGIADIFSGGPAAPQRTHLLTIGRRPATRLEKLFATGTGSTASPAAMNVEGALSTADLIGL